MADELRCHGCELSMMVIGGGIRLQDCPHCGKPMVGYSYVRRPTGRGRWCGMRSRCRAKARHGGLLLAQEQGALADEIERLREWGKQMTEVALDRTYSEATAPCGELVNETVCSEGVRHEHLCGRPAVQFEVEYGDYGGKRWVLRCADHSCRKPGPDAVALEPSA